MMSEIIVYTSISRVRENAHVITAAEGDLHIQVDELGILFVTNDRAVYSFAPGAWFGTRVESGG